MNYRHAFHAGGIADVFKHAVLTHILLHLRGKETPFCVLDTHAGAGRYDLGGEEAARTGEWRDGIGRLIAGGPDPLLDPYFAILRAANRGWPDIRVYPGSPAITRALLRPQDRMVAAELHAEDARLLRRVFAADRQATIHLGDGYGMLKALLPPKERRGLALIDPPFEEKDEFARLAKALPGALRRWATGIYAVWYPIKAPEPVARFLAECAGLGRPVLVAELLLHPPDDPNRLNGSGIVIVNPPWKLDGTLEQLVALLGRRLGATGGGAVRWLAAQSVLYN